jgi:subtilisin family serine protease
LRLDAAAESRRLHRLLGIDALGGQITGRGVSIAVVDSGLAPNPDAPRAAGGRNLLQDADPASWNVDDKGHGTHCSGIIAAPGNPGGPRGIAPNVSLYMLKVFPGGYVSDLVEAIEWCVAQKIDLVNMSLGSDQPSAVLGAALADANRRGITILAAAGNNHAPVSFPASAPTVIGVSAFGRLGAFPDSSAHALAMGGYRDWWGGLFDARFSNFGSEVAVSVPGVAIASTVPTGYAAWDGTSMACPIVTSLAALALQSAPWLRTGDAATPSALRQILTTAAVDTGLPPLLQGRGFPTALRVISAAVQYSG